MGNRNKTGRLRLGREKGFSIIHFAKVEQIGNIKNLDTRESLLGSIAGV